MERAFFPLDEELGLLAGQYTPQVYGWIVQLSGWMPFGAAAKLATGLLGVGVSKSSARRAAESTGAAYVAIQTEQAARLEQQAPPAPASAGRLVVSADGAMVPLVHGEWGEVRTVAIGTVVQRRVRCARRRRAVAGAVAGDVAGDIVDCTAAAATLDAAHGVPPVAASGKRSMQRKESVLQTVNISYFSRFTSAETFTRLALTETHQRGLENAQQVAAVMDGADWLQQFADHHCPQAVRILDFAHAAQRITEVAQALWGQGSEEAATWTTTWTTRLKEEGPQQLLTELRRLRAIHTDNEPLRINLAYLEKRQKQLAYPHFSQQSWPIGSGMVESANKLVVEARLKGAGMHWQRSNVDPMLALRNLLGNNRWEQEWPQIKAHLIAQTRHRRLPACQQRLQSLQDQQRSTLIAAQHAQYAALRPEPATDLLPVSATPPTPKSPKPARDHPWRRSPIGKARFN